MIKKPKVIVFDVDNTIIRGNLTISFIKLLMREGKSIKERLFYLRKSFILLVRGAFLLLFQLPRTTKKILLKNRNSYTSRTINKLDISITKKIGDFYKLVFDTFQELNLTDKKLQNRANQLFTKDFFKKQIYTASISEIKRHLQDKNTIVVLLSGSLNEFLTVFLNIICKELTKDKIDWHNRIFAHGTVITHKTVIPCVGSEKYKILQRLLENHGYYNYNINYIYSDNGCMADLPLLIKSKTGGVLICKKTSIYKLLPRKLISMFVFRPAWE